MKRNFFLRCGMLAGLFVVSLRAQNFEKEEEAAALSSSPLMMFRGDEPSQSQEERERQAGQEQRDAEPIDQTAPTSTLKGSTTSRSQNEQASSIPSDGELRAHIQDAIKITETIHVAGDLFQQQQEAKRNLARDYPEVDWNSSAALDAMIKEELLKRYKQELAIELGQSPVSSNLTRNQNVATGSHQVESQRAARQKEMAAREALILKIQRKKEAVAAKLKATETLEGTTFVFNPVRIFRANTFDLQSLFSADEIKDREVIKDYQKLYREAVETAESAYRHALGKVQENEARAMNDRNLKLVTLETAATDKMEEAGDYCQQAAEALQWGNALSAATFIGRQFFVTGHGAFGLGGLQGCAMGVSLCLETKSALLEKKLFVLNNTKRDMQLAISSVTVQSRWIEAIISNEEAMEYYRLAVESYQKGDIKKGDCLGGDIITAGAGSSCTYASFSFQESAWFLEKSELSAGAVSDAWKEASETMNVAANLYLRAAEASKIENMPRSTYLAGIGFGTYRGAAAATQRAADHLKERATALELGNIKEAEQFFQKAQDQLRRAEAYKKGDRATGDSMKDANECVIQ